MNHILDQSGVKAFVSNIEWERIHLHLDISLEMENKQWDPSQLEFFAVNTEGEAWLRFQVVKITDIVFSVKANITNNGMKQCVPEGTYRIYVCCGADVLAECETDTAIADKMEALSRGFLYGGQSKSYNVNFYIEDGGETLPFRMRTINLTKTNLDFPYNPSFKGRIKNAFLDCFFKTRPNIRRFYKLFSKLYKNKRKDHVLIMTEQSTTIGGNLKALSDRMKKRGLDSQFHINYSARKASDKNHGVKSWIHLVKLLAQSGTVFLDDHAPVLDWLHLDEDTCVVQLWHAGAGFKSSGYSRWGHLGCPAPQSCHRQYRYGVSGSKNIAHFFSEVWGINDENVLPTGMPRMDEFQDENHKQKKIQELYEQFPMCKGKKVILFAPTYRGKNNSNAYYPYELINFEKLYQLCGEEYVVLFKMHPWVIEDIHIEEKYADKFLDVKTYPNINDLFYIVDLLITDYSSNIYEYSLMRKPMLFFAFDKIQYSFSRGFHRAYEEAAPGKVCYTFEEVLDAIAREDFEYEKVEEYVKHHFDHFDSNASDRIIDWILLDQMPVDIRENIRRKDEEVKKMRRMQFEIPEEYLGGDK